MQEDIDAVITWVEGNNPVHKAKIEKFLHENTSGIMDYATLEGRFIEMGEVKYCIHSIRKFAPWIRNIYLVTDEQCPSWLTEEVRKKLNVIIIDHKEIFKDYPGSLPTFNNLSIMSLIWKVPGITNKHILFNDDNFLISNIEPDDFFEDDKIKFRGKWHLQSPGILKIGKRMIKQVIRARSFNRLKWNSVNPQINGARLAGDFINYFDFIHAPLPLIKDIQEKFYLKNPSVLEKNVCYRFRNNNQFGPGILVVHLALIEGRALFLEGEDSEMIIPCKGGLMKNRYKFDNLKDNNKKFLCFQDLFYLAQENPEEYAEVIDYLSRTTLSNTLV